MKARQEIAELLKAEMGLDVPTVGWAALDHAVRLRASIRGVDDEAEYWELLRRLPEELQELVETIVVPETWFFRDLAAFTALTDVVCNEWLPARPHRVIRILSEPCSTGEEPYSIAMALLDAGVPPERFIVDGVDISARAVALAGQAVYGNNSFRGGDLLFRERYFHRRQGRYEMRAEVRERARFRQGNLLDPAVLAGTEPYDVVFCRNVLIYFDSATQQRVMDGLERVLAGNGLLCVGAAEPFLLRERAFVSTGHPCAFAYRKATARSSREGLALRHSRRQGIARPAATPGARQLPSPRRPRVNQPAVERAERPIDLEAAKRLADAGQLAEAARACEAYLQASGPSADAYYLLGLVRDSMGIERMAADFYRKAIYLDPSHLEALTHLALLVQRQGDLALARRLHNRARRIQEGAKP